jgi:tellurite resistance protein
MSDHLVQRQCAQELVDIGALSNLPDKTALCSTGAYAAHEKPGTVMPRQYAGSSATTAEHIADYLDSRDEDVLRGLVTAGAFVALADHRVEETERDELVNFIDRQRFVPSIPRAEIAELFDRRVRQFEKRDSAELIIENLRPLVGLSLGSIVLRTAERVALSDRRIHPGESEALDLIRLIMTSLSAKKPPARSRLCNRVRCESAFDARCFHGKAVRFSGLKIQWPYQLATTRRLALSWGPYLGKQISLAMLVGGIVGLAINFWTRPNVAIPTGAGILYPNEKQLPSNPHSHSPMGSQNEPDSIDPKHELLPMFNPYLPFRVLEPVY